MSRWNVPPRILALDIATTTGWAFFDVDRHVSAIRNGVFKFGDDIKADDGRDGKTAMHKRRILRRAMHDRLVELYDEYRPTAICLEQPLNYIKSGAPKGKKLPIFKGDQTVNPKQDKGGGPNASTVLALNQLYAVADEFFWAVSNPIGGVTLEPFCLFDVAPTTWQTMTKQFPGDTKERSIAYCEAAGIALSYGNKKDRGDAADASVIAVWAETAMWERKVEQIAALQNRMAAA